MLKTGQTMQPQVQNRLRLNRRKVVPAVAKSVLGSELIGSGVRLAGPLEHVRDGTGRPALRDQGIPCFGRRRRRLYEFDDLVDVCQRHRLAFQHVRPVPGLPQIEYRSPRHDLTAMGEESLENLLEVHQLRLTVVQRHHVDAEHRLHRRLLVQVIQHDIGRLAALEFDDDTHAVLVRLVPQFADPLDALFTDEVGDLLDEPGLVDLVRQLRDDDSLPSGLEFLDFRSCTDVDAPAACSIGRIDALSTVDDAGGRKVRPGQVLHERRDVDRRILDQCQAGTDHLTEIVRRNIGRHADGDAG